MIASLSGKILAVTDKYLVIEVAGIGYRVFVTAETLLKYPVEASLFLWTAHVVREDATELYGFETLEDQDLFELLRSVSGIGPRSALGVMNVATRGTIARAVHTNDVGYLTKISGIGKKTAEKIIIELRDKIDHFAEPSHGDATHNDALDALVALGYSESAARESLRNISGDSDTQTRIREALKVLSRNG